MSKRKKIIISIFALILIVIIGVFLVIAKKQTPQYITEKTQIKNLIQTVSATGELVSEEKINLNFEISGKLKSEAKIGQKVIEGETIGQLDNSSISKDVEKAFLALGKVKAETGINDDKIAEAERNAENTKEYYEEIENLENQKVDATDQEYENACDYYEAALAYYNKIVEEEGTDDNSTALYAKLTLETAKKTKNSAEQSKDTARRNRDLSITSAENNYKLAKDQLQTVESDFSQTTKNIAVQSAQIDYEKALQNLEKSILKAPVNGLITKVNYKTGEVLGNTLSQPFAEIISYDFIVESNIPESDIAKIKLGQEAGIIFDALTEEEKFIGEVVEIEPASTVIQEVVYYKTKFKLKNSDQKLKAGMSCDIEIKIDEKNNVLSIPQRAIMKNEGREEVKILQKDQIQIKSIQTGLEDDEGMIEIISGLKEGEEIILGEEE